MMPQLKGRKCFSAVLVLLVMTIALINAPAESFQQIIVKASQEDLDRIRTSVGAAIVDAIPGYFLISVPSSVDPTTVEKVTGKGPIQASGNGPVVIPRTGRPTANGTTGGTVPSSTVPSSLGGIVDWYGTPVRQGYTDQTVVGKIALKQALNFATGSGVKVALIDTGVDLQHPALQGVFVGGTSYVGYTSDPSVFNDTTMPQLSQSASNFLEQSSSNFLEQSASNFLEQSSSNFLEQSASNFLEQSSSNFLEQSASNFLEQSSSNFLEQSSSNFLEQASSGVFVSQSASNFLEGTTNLPLYTSHGTMMAGLIHLVAPRAQITPIAAFHVTGDSSEWNIIRAIYAAIQSGDQVINMSFETGRKSKIMEAAINDALSRGIVVIASAGNESSEVRTYPGSFNGVIRVAGVRDDNDQKAAFSNYSTDIGVSATSTQLISTWVGGHWGMITGTSPAAALVTGEVALVIQNGSNAARVETKVDSINWPPQYKQKLGTGRINAFKAVSPNN